MSTYRLLPAAALTVLAACTACTASTTAGPVTPTSAPGASSSVTPTAPATASASATAGPLLSAADYDSVLPDLPVPGSPVTAAPDAGSRKASLLQFFTGYPDLSGTSFTPAACATVVNPFADVADTKAKIMAAADPKVEYFVVVGSPGPGIATIRQQVTDCASTTVTSSTNPDVPATIKYTPDGVLSLPASGEVPLVNIKRTSPPSGELNFQIAVAQVRGVAVLVGVSSTTALTNDLKGPVQGLMVSTVQNILAK